MGKRSGRGETASTAHRPPVARAGGDQNGATGRKPETVRIKLLGGFQISVGSRTVGEDGWRLRKARCLVKLLALEPGHRMHREQIMEWLWPDLDPKAAANNLHYALHVARRTLEPASATSSCNLQLRDDWLTLCPDGPLWIDVEAFEEATAMARRTREPVAYQAALSLYAGDLLPGDRYEDWAEARRGELRRMFLSLLIELAALHEEREEFEPAIETLQRAIAAEPAHEEAHAGLMRLHALSGRQIEALEQYERLREFLSRELCTEPGAASRRLREEILAGQFSPSPSPARSMPQDDRPAEETPGTLRHNLPADRSSFVGREREVLEAKRELAMTRLLTFIGTGGCGKTRLAVAVAKDLAAAYPDGAWLVKLAPLSDPELVPLAVAEALSVREQPGRPLHATLTDHLQAKEMLLILDNCEHLIEAVAGLADDLLGACPRLRVLATSREALRTPGEVVWRVPSLSVPDPADTASIEELRCYEAVRLFLERARSRRPGFELTDENAGVVVEICRRLDGMPLAIELAAARVGVLSAQQIAARLDDSLGLLRGGTRTSELRHRTLQGTLDWSHGLLSPAEKSLFRKLSVFVGGWTLEAAEAVGAGNGIGEGEVLDLLSELVDKSLVVAETSGNGTLRYRMLEPVRQYGRKKLKASGEAEAVWSQHSALFLALAEEAEPELRGAQQETWRKRLEEEHDNLRVALSWALEQGKAEPELRLSGALGALGEFWHLRGHLDEGRRWLKAVLAKGDALPEPTRAKALVRAGWIAWERQDYRQAVALSEEGLALSRKLGDMRGTATSLVTLGWVAMCQNEHERASALLEEALALRRELGDMVGVARSLQALGFVALGRHDYERAMLVYEESLALAQKMNDKLGSAVSLGMGALAFLGQGNHQRVRALCAEGLELSQQLRMKHTIAFCLHVSAALASSQRQPVRSARLWGAAQALLEAIGITLSPLERHHYGPYIAAAHTQVDEEAWEVAWAEGWAMTPEVAIEYALTEEEQALITTTPAPKEPSVERQPAVLTCREREIAVLVARGLTNRQIATELVISEHTVATHIGKILKKLGLHSRTQIAAWIAE